MRKFSAFLCVLLAGSGFAFGGTAVMSSGKEMKQVAPMPPPCPNWSGVYVGLSGGWDYGVVNTGLGLGGDWNSFTSARDTIESNSDDFSFSGGDVGGVLGYNYVVHNWLFGAEVAGGGLWLRDSDSSGAFTTNIADYDLTESFKTHWRMTFGPRIGYTFCKWMPYVTGGLAVGDLEYFQKLNQLPPAPEFHQLGDVHDTNVGWMVGGGLEYAVTNHWRVRGQYQYIDLGSVGFHSIGNDSNNFTGSHGASLHEHSAQFAIIYGF
jgi:outer membrane immunogenic protein